MYFIAKKFKGGNAKKLFQMPSPAIVTTIKLTAAGLLNGRKDEFSELSKNTLSLVLSGRRKPPRLLIAEMDCFQGFRSRLSAPAIIHPPTAKGF
jgi:hypothetical protein